MFYYILRIQMKYTYYITHDMDKYKELLNISNKYEENFGKPLFLYRLGLLFRFPYFYIYGYFVHKNINNQLHEEYRKYNKWIKSIWLEHWKKGYSNIDSYFI